MVTQGSWFPKPEYQMQRVSLIYPLCLPKYGRVGPYKYLLEMSIFPVGPYKYLLEMSIFLSLNFIGHDIFQDESENMNVIQSLSVCQGSP